VMVMRALAPTPNVPIDLSAPDRRTGAGSHIGGSGRDALLNWQCIQKGNAVHWPRTDASDHQCVGDGLARVAGVLRGPLVELQSWARTLIGTDVRAKGCRAWLAVNVVVERGVDPGVHCGRVDIDVIVPAIRVHKVWVTPDVDGADSDVSAPIYVVSPECAFQLCAAAAGDTDADTVADQNGVVQLRPADSGS
jgi:hypothetical protein